MIEIGRFGITIEDFENGFGKEITSNGPILDSWWQVHVHTNRKIRFTFRISNLLSVKTDNIEPNFDVIILSWPKTHKLFIFACFMPSNDLSWPRDPGSGWLELKKYTLNRIYTFSLSNSLTFNKLIVTIRKYRFKIFVAVIKFCCVRLETGFGTFCILELVMSIWTF